MAKTAVRAAVAGLAVAGAAVVLPAQAASAAPAGQNGTRVTAAAAYTHGGSIHVAPKRDIITATGWIKDHTSGRDFVAVQTFIERHDRKGWVTVSRDARRTGNNSASSTIKWRKCTNGRVYRAKVNYNWNNKKRFHSYTRTVKC